MVLGLPRLAALTDKIFLSLLGLLALVSGRLFMDVMLFVLINLGEPLNGVLVDQGVVLIDSFLPFCLSTVVQAIFALSQATISLASSELRGSLPGASGVRVFLLT